MFSFRSLSESKPTPTEKRSLVYQGKAKTLYKDANGSLIQLFRDDITAGNGDKASVIEGKGMINSLISGLLMTRLQEIGLPNHLIRRLSVREQLIHKTDVIPLEVVVRNIAAGSLCQRLGLKKGELLRRPMVEFFYKNDNLNDPLVSEENIFAMGWAQPPEMDEIIGYALRINDFLSGYLAAVGIRLVDMKLEFGRLTFDSGDETESSIILIDEISPDTTRLWDLTTGRVLDKDRFRQDLGSVAESYREIAARLGVLSSVTGTPADPAKNPIDTTDPAIVSLPRAQDS